MNTMEAIHARYSCRSFSDRMPSDEDLQMIAKAAVAAPSAMNQQSWRVIVVKNHELLAELEEEAMRNVSTLEDKSAYDRIMSRGGKIYYNTPCQIILAIDADSGTWGNLDCGIITQNIALAATSLGINSLICGMIRFSFEGGKGDEFKARLGFPDGYDIGISVLLGYADESGVKPPHELNMSKISYIE